MTDAELTRIMLVRKKFLKLEPKPKQHSKSESLQTAMPLLNEPVGVAADARKGSGRNVRDCGVPANAASVHQRNAAPDAIRFSLTARERHTSSSFGCPATGSATSEAAPW